METIEFYGRKLYVGVTNDGTRVVAIKPICESIGIAYQAQWAKVKEDPKFNHHDIVTTGADGKNYKMFCLPISQVNGWLFGVNANRVAPVCQENLLAYQRECQNVLFQHFMPQGGTNAEIFALVATLQKGLLEIRQDIANLRGELDEAQTLIGTLCMENVETEIRSLIQEVKSTLGMSKAAIIGHVRKTTGMSKLYETCNPALVKNVLRNLLGRGVFGAVTQ